MALVLQSAEELSELEKMGCSLQSELPHFFKKLAERMSAKAPANIGDVFSSCADAIQTDFLVDNVQDMFLTVYDSQIQNVLVQTGGKATWKNIIELVAGVKFKSSAPAAALVPLSPAFHNTVEPTFTISPLGAQMENEDTLKDEHLPAYVLTAHSECEDPQEQELTAPDITAVLDAYTHYMIRKHNQPAGDKRMRLHHSRELKLHYPKLCAHGKTPGSMRRWLKLLDERKRNYSRKSALKARGPFCTSTHTRRVPSTSHISFASSNATACTC